MYHIHDIQLTKALVPILLGGHFHIFSFCWRILVDSFYARLIYLMCLFHHSLWFTGIFVKISIWTESSVISSCKRCHVLFAPWERFVSLRWGIWLVFYFSGIFLIFFLFFILSFFYLPCCHFGCYYIKYHYFSGDIWFTFGIFTISSILYYL